MSLSRFTLRQFEAFVTVAETLSFKDAGDRLGLTPSAISQLVVELEATLGLRLFNRTTRKVELSTAGRDLLGSVEAVIKHVGLTEMAAANLRNQAAGMVHIAAPQVIAGMILPKIVKDYTEQHPKVVVVIRDTPVEGLVDAVSTGEVDLAVGPDRPYGAGTEREPLFESPWVLWCSPQHPLASKSNVEWDDLNGHPIVAAGRDHEHSVARMRSDLPGDSRISPSMIVDHVSTALGMAAAEHAITLSPAYVGILARPMGLVMRRIIKPESIRQICLYRSTRRAPSPASAGFAEHVIEWIASHNVENDVPPGE